MEMMNNELKKQNKKSTHTHTNDNLQRRRGSNFGPDTTARAANVRSLAHETYTVQFLYVIANGLILK